MAVSAPPRKKASTAATQPGAVDEKKIEEIISRGSSTVGQAAPQPQADPLKQFNVKMLESQLRAIDEVRAKRPKKPTSRKDFGVSLQDWVIEACTEKLARERKQFKLG